MGKVIGAVLAGAAVWAVLWIGGNFGLAAAFPDIIVMEQPLDHVPMLLFLVVYSVVLSALAGYVTAAVKGTDPMGAVKSLAAVQLSLGLFFEISAWNLLPVWYHIVFLVLIVPAVVWGGQLRGGQSSE